MVEEKVIRPAPGWSTLGKWAGLFFGGIFLVVLSAAAANAIGPIAALGLLVGAVMFAASIVTVFGFQAVAPNDARVLLLFGEYKGSIKESGFYWVNPFYSKRRVSLRVRNFETGSMELPPVPGAGGAVVRQTGRTAGRPSKVNDRDGNPIEISAVVVWQVVDTAEALFEVDNFEHFVAVQSESALRNLASRHPYDSGENEISLRGSTEEVCQQLQVDIQDRLFRAGVKVIEARISHLAYAPEIAAAMLQRQQAQAIVDARSRIVEGAVGMVEMALNHLTEGQIVDLDTDRRAALVSNLLVVLCSDRHTQPIVNTGAA